ncbi:uncharacterized protein LOC120037260 [Salvelinus namaycush]|nr:uncharacterized protein LOC120037260 [Salvelinus namaycush]
MKTDSGTYWCGVERYGPDTYQEVHLTVTDGLMVWTSVGLVAKVTVLGLVLLLFYRQRRGTRRTPPPVSSNTQPDPTGEVDCMYEEIREADRQTHTLPVVISSVYSTVNSPTNSTTYPADQASTTNPAGQTSTTYPASQDSTTYPGCHGDGDYEEIMERPLRSDSGAATSTIYATANLPTSHSDSLHYASVNFHKNPSGPNEATDTITKEGSCPNETTAAITTEGTSSCDYATVNKSPAYSTVNHPHSCSEAPPIYSTISKPRDT